MERVRSLRKWLTPGIGVKRWLLLFLVGVFSAALSLCFALIKLSGETFILPVTALDWPTITVTGTIGAALALLALIRFTRALLAPYRLHQLGRVVDIVYEHNRRQRGLKVVAIGGGTGLPAVLRGLKPYTSNITAIVTVSDDGGSSGRLRRDLGVLPPGDLRNNIAALADDEKLMTQLFQYRFQSGDLEGHSFGNLFIAALAAVSGDHSDNRNSLAEALTETGRVLNIQGRVLPATLDDVRLEAMVRLNGTSRVIRVRGESQIAEIDGQIEEISLSPVEITAYPESVQAILDADLIVIGPGSLYTSILPNLLVPGIADALRATSAYKIYVCNVALQPVETGGYTVAEHVLALERHIGRGVFQLVLANNAYPSRNAGENTRYVPPAPDNHEILQRYELRYTDLTDPERPWRHDPRKLGDAILLISREERRGIYPPLPVQQPVSLN